MAESYLSRIARVVVGALLVVESIVLVMVGVFAGIVGGLAGALAFAAGGGGATDAQLAQGFALVAISLASPFVVAAALVLAGILLPVSRGRGVIVAAGIFALAAQ